MCAYVEESGKGIYVLLYLLSSDKNGTLYYSTSGILGVGHTGMLVKQIQQTVNT